MSFFSSRSPRYATIATLVIAALVLAGCASEMNTAPQTTFSDQGNNAAEILALFRPVFWVATAVFVLVEGLLIYSVIRFRRRPQDGIPLQIHGNTPIEIAWTIIPAIIVLGIATLTFRTQANLEYEGENPLQVTVVGHQWWWEFQYPEYGIITANELHIPAGRDIEFTLESADVIHSFWFPRLAGKTDNIPFAYPNDRNKLTFRANEVSEATLIRGECAEFCGGTHAMMGMYAVVSPPAVFEQWVQQQQQDAVVPAGITPATQATAEAGVAVGATVEAGAEGETVQADPDGTPVAGGQASDENPANADAVVTETAAAEVVATVEATIEAQAETTATSAATSLEARGYELFASKGCVGCHAISGYPGAVSRTGPDLTHIGSRQHIVAGWLENTPENMARWLRDPDGVKPGNLMAGVVQLGTLKEDEIAALTAYLRSLE
jgi:cytochrome c oxidase subunit II